jgi:hypothetical protein
VATSGKHDGTDKDRSRTSPIHYLPFRNEQKQQQKEKTMNIIESIGKWGVKSTSHNLTRIRIERPESGDIIEFTDTNYPHTSGKYGRIESIEGDTANICVHLGSAFLREDGSVSISGGPFEYVKLEQLEPTYTLYLAPYWNWGNNSPGANQKVTYHFERPVFKLNISHN